MLIRSQNRELLINFNNAPAIGIMEVKGDAKITCSDTNETLDIGSYSTKAKAMKVLDMIQEAYCKFMSVKNDDAWDGKESVFCKLCTVRTVNAVSMENIMIVTSIWKVAEDIFEEIASAIAKYLWRDKKCG